MNTEILLGVGMFTAIIMVLVTVILMARKQLVAAGAVDIEINGDPDKTLSTAAGGKLLGTLADAGIFLSSACGGGGTCRGCGPESSWLRSSPQIQPSAAGRSCRRRPSFTSSGRLMRRSRRRRCH